MKELTENNNNIISLDNAMDGFINNISDEELDTAIKVYNKVCRLFGVKTYNDAYILTTDSEYDIKENKNQLGSEVISVFPKLSLEVYTFGDDIIIREQLGSIINLYFKTEEIGEKYINTVNSIQ